MQKIKNLLNNKIIDKIIKIITYISNSPILYTLVLLGLVLFVTLFCHPHYQTCDDLIMKSIIDGSYSVDGAPRAFVMWQHLYYTTFLQKLYIKMPNIHWYDIFTYLFMSVSLVITTLCLYTKTDKNKNIFNLFLFIISFFIYLAIFICPQFSITAGCLTISGFLLAYNVIIKKHSILNNIIILFMSILCFLQASLIRFEVSCILLPLALFISLLLCKKEYYKKYLCVLFCIVISYGISYGFNLEYKRLIKANEEYNYIYQNHMKRLEISDRTALFNDKTIYFHFLRSLNKIPNIDEKLKSVGWNKGTYLVSLAWLDWGDDDIFNPQKMESVRKALNKELLIQRKFNLSFSVADWLNIAKYYFLALLFLFLAFPSKKGAKKTLLLISCYYAIILLSNNIFKILPLRVFLNLLNLLVLSTFLVLKESFIEYNYCQYLKNSIEKFKNINKRFNFNFKPNFNLNLNFEKINAFLPIIIAIFLFSFAAKPIKMFNAHNFQHYRAYKETLADFKNLDKSKIYITDMLTNEIFSAPFAKSLFKQGINVLSINSMFINKYYFLKKYNIPTKNTLKAICERDDIYYYHHNYKPYNNFFASNNMIALQMFMKETYGKELSFPIVKRMNNGETLVNDIHILTSEEMRLKDVVVNINNNIWINDVIKNERDI